MQGPGISSEAIWTPFATIVTSSMRVLKWALNVSWNRVQDPDTGFVTVGSSIVGGTDIIKGSGVGATTNLDTFLYDDETDRVLGLDYDRQLPEPLGGISTALLSVLLDNTDKRFTPDFDDTIGTAILPKRPINAHIGLLIQSQSKTVTVFKGLTLMPEENKTQRTLKLPCQDYASYLLNQPMDSAKYTDQRSDEIIADILSELGFGSSQYELDTGLNTIGFAYFEKGQSAGARITKICQAEEAVFYQDESGVLRFENRRKYSQAPYNSSIHTIHGKDIISWEGVQNMKIINKVVVKARPRFVLANNVDFWQDTLSNSTNSEREIAAGETITIWANFKDPVDSIVDPASTTDYTANAQANGGGADMTSDVSITITKFTTAAKLEIENTHVSDTLYLTLLKLRGKPAVYIDDSQDPPVSREVLEVYQDDDSINKYDEQELTIENDFISDPDYAQELAQHIVNKYKEPGRIIKLRVQGLPHLQLRDQVYVQDIDIE